MEEQMMEIACILCGKLFEIEKSPDGKPVGARICDSCWKCPKCGVGIESNISDYSDGFLDEGEGYGYCHV